MDALLQVQAELTARLDYESYLQYISVKSWRAHVISSDVDKQLPHLAGKNGKLGCGIIVGMPTLEGVDQNVSTPQSEILVPVDTVEIPELNMDP